MKRAPFLARVEYLRTLIVPEWRISVIVDATHLDEDQVALMQADEDYEHAEIAFTKAARKSTQQQVDQVIAHELIHCLTREHRRVMGMADVHVSPAVGEVLNAAYVTAEEKLVERLSRIVSGCVVYGTTHKPRPDA